jgi:hydrogenase-1 operon protein HyaF
LWDVRTFSSDGAVLDRHLEVGPIPLVVEAAARDLTVERYIMPKPEDHAGQELMNVMPLLFEIDARMQDLRPSVTNHVISLTNLPMTDGDLALLGKTIGGGEIRAFSKGYGATRITSTRARGVWQVEYLNAMGTVILDTIEIGGPPAALLAAQEDFEDSCERLIELLEVS